MSDNFHFDLTGVSLEKCMDIACQVSEKYRGKMTIGWSEVPVAVENQGAEGIWGASQGKSRLILFWAGSNTMTKVPSPMNVGAIVPFIKSWLEAQDYGKQPNHDGDNGKGWRVYNESWGHVAGIWEAFVAIEPVWLLYGK